MKIRKHILKILSALTISTLMLGSITTQTLADVSSSGGKPVNSKGAIMPEKFIINGESNDHSFFGLGGVGASAEYASFTLYSKKNLVNVKIVVLYKDGRKEEKLIKSFLKDDRLDFVYYFKNPLVLPEYSLDITAEEPENDNSNNQTEPKRYSFLLKDSEKIELENSNSNKQSETNDNKKTETKRKITLDKKLNNKKITVEFTTKDKKQYELETTEITKTEKQKIAENLQDKNLEIVVFDLKLIDKQTRKEIKTEEERTVKIALTENLTNKEVKVYYINEKTNKLEEIPSTVENNVVVFQTNHFSKYAVVTKNKEKQTQNKKDNKLPKTSAVKK